MTVEQLIAGISKMLDSEFGLPIYKERVEQGTETPCFFVRSYRNKSVRRSRFKHQHDIDMEVVYFPTETGPCMPRRAKSEMNDISDRLMYLLEMIDVDGKLIRAREREAVVSDDTLVMTFQVTIDEVEKPDVEIMLNEQTEIMVK